jgi:hypothetical protein
MTYVVAQTRGAALAPLSPLQRQKLAAMAHYAYHEMQPVGVDFDTWRHDQVQRLVGKPGLTHCVNEDFNPLKAAFLEMAGKMQPALAAALKGATEQREWALFSLYRACTEAKDVLPAAMAYARGFIKNKRATTLEDADSRTIWHAVFTVRRKAQKERAKRGGGEPAADVLGKLLASASGARRKA